MPASTCLSPAPGSLRETGSGSISLVPALTADLGCSQYFYFKPHNVYEEAVGVHS